MNIKEIFNTISKSEGHTFKLYESYTPKTEFYVLDENGEQIKVDGMVLKKEPIIKIVTDKATFRVADEHAMMGEHSQKWVKELKVGDKLPMTDGLATIISIEEDGTELVYDLAVDSEAHLYQDSNGFIHHNTFHIEKTMKSLLGSPEGPDAKWRHRKGAKLSPFGLYMDLFVNRDNKTIVYDDSDSVFSDKDAINILKGAIDTYAVRTVEWPSRATVNLELMGVEEKEEYLMSLETALRETPEDVGTKIKLPSKFDFTSRIIFISNLNASKFEKDPNLNAIKSRSFFIDVQLKREDVILRIRSLLPFISPEVDLSIKEEILESLIEGTQELTMRAVVAAIAIKNAGLDDWKRLVTAYA